MMKRLCFFLLCAVLVITASCGVAETSDITPQNAEVQQTGPEMSANQEAAQVGVFDFENRTVLLNSGYTMPIMGLGTYALDYDTCVSSVMALIANGGRLIDTAYMYGNEEAVGEGVRLAMAEYGVPREEIFVITKIYPSQFSDPEAAIEMALEKLDIGYIDMMLLHHPGSNDVNAYLTMEKYVAAGKIRSLGLSNWYIEELTEFLPQVNIKPAMVQNEIHPYYQEQGVVPFIQEKGIVVQCWYPLGGRGYTKQLLTDETITAIASAHGVSAAQVILRWDLQRGIVVIPGSSNPDHIRENLDLFGFELTSEDMEQIAVLDRDEKHDWLLIFTGRKKQVCNPARMNQIAGLLLYSLVISLYSPETQPTWLPIFTARQPFATVAMPSSKCQLFRIEAIILFLTYARIGIRIVL